MSPFVPALEERHIATQWSGKLPVDHEIPPQYTPPVATAVSDLRDKFNKSKPAEFLVAPQEEKVATARAGKSPLDKGLNRLEQEINNHSIFDSSTANERVRDRQVASSVPAGAAGVTGEDLSTTENVHIV